MAGESTLRGLFYNALLTRHILGDHLCEYARWWFIYSLLTYANCCSCSITLWRNSMIIYAWMDFMTSIARPTCKRAFPYRLSRCGTQCCWPSKRSFIIIMASNSGHIAQLRVGYRRLATWPHSMWLRIWYSWSPMASILVCVGTEPTFKQSLICFSCRKGT